MMLWEMTQEPGVPFGGRPVHVVSVLVMRSGAIGTRPYPLLENHADCDEDGQGRRHRRQVRRISTPAVTPSASANAA